jgi:BASS family bile acid:Na+ symporter
MEPAQLIKLALTASIPLLVFALGLRATFAETTTLFRELFRPPNRLLRALVAIYVIVPVAAAALALLGDLSRPVKVALLAMAVAPIPPILPGKQLKFGGEKSYVFGLLVAVSLVAILLVPLGVDVLGRVFGRESRFSPIEVARLIGMTILAPLVVGLMLRHAAPRLAQATAPWASRAGTILLVGGLVPVLIKVWPTVAALVGDGSVLAIAALVVVAIVAGHAMGGPDPDERATLALASAMRHPGIAAAIASLNIPDEPRVPAAIILYLLVATVGTSLYGSWSKRRLPAGS